MRQTAFAVLVLVLVLSSSLIAGTAAGQDDPDLIACSAEAQWLNCPDSIRMADERGRSFTLHLLGQVSDAPSNLCLGADLHLTAAYMNSEGDILCVGTLERIARLAGHVQDIAIELNPSVLQTFGRWLNEPLRQADPPFTPLRCVASNGRTQLLDSHLAEAVGLSLTATLLPRTGGLATAECRIPLVR